MNMLDLGTVKMMCPNEEDTEIKPSTYIKLSIASCDRNCGC